MWIRIEQAALAAGLTLLIASCAAPTIKHEHELAPGRAFDAKMTTALLIPLNETMQVQVGMEPGVASTTRLMVEYLSKKGLVVEQPSMNDYRKAIQQAASRADRARRAGESNSVSETISMTEIIPHLLDLLGSEADLIVTPNMVIRSGQYGGGNAVRWDGVRRTERGTRDSVMSGTTSVASLFTVLYDANGTQIFSGYGGLDMLFELNLNRKRYDLRPNRLKNDKNLAEGICISLHPFFGENERC